MEGDLAARKSRTQGYLALILHSHLPFVRHPEYEEALEENWFFECMTDTYIPLLMMMDRLVNEKIRFRLTMSLTPTLVSMFDNQMLRSRYVRRLDRLIELSEKEIIRTGKTARLHMLAHIYRKRLLDIKNAFAGTYELDLTRAFAALQQSGHIEILASSATHAYLPLLANDPVAVKTQLKTGIDSHKKSFGRPRGFWLPECGYYPGLDNLLYRYGVRYTILETHGITRAKPAPAHGIYAPAQCPSGLVVFGRDPDSSRQVWSSAEGYPGDCNYREFYRDIAYDLGHEYLAPYIHPAGIRTDTGFKYYRITGKTESKRIYCTKTAVQKAEQHAEDFISKKLARLAELGRTVQRKPVFIAPFDTELFGHWWYEGPVWLEALIRNLSYNRKKLRLVTLSEYVNEYPQNQQVTPSISSWGDMGYHKRWLNVKNDWIYSHLHNALRTLNKITAARPAARGLVRRALNQACRELLLAQSSDWAFMIEGGKTADYAIKRLKTHLIRIDRLAYQIEAGAIDKRWLEALEEQDNIFHPINYRDWAEPYQPPLR